MTDEQALALARLARDREANFSVHRAPFDLPTGYIMVVFSDRTQFTCGIAPDGSVSS
jgi:hypothetical protein